MNIYTTYINMCISSKCKYTYVQLGMCIITITNAKSFACTHIYIIIYRSTCIKTLPNTIYKYMNQHFKNIFILFNSTTPPSLTPGSRSSTQVFPRGQRDTQVFLSPLPQQNLQRHPCAMAHTSNRNILV